MSLDKLEKRYGRRNGEAGVSYSYRPAQGGKRVGEWHHRARHTDAIVELVREWYQRGVVGRGIRATAEHFDLPQSTVRDYVRERTRIL
jgi:hypothetical protein